jgi:amidophosphoribosyltransferase
MCGIIAIVNHPEAAHLARLGLHALQHRGEEACGICSSDGNNISLIKKCGWVGDSITDEDCNKLQGDMAIGHTRYSTEGGSLGANIQPLFAKLKEGEIVLAHNGHLARSLNIRKKLEDEGSIFQTSTDTEIILHLMAKSKKDSFFDKLQEALQLTSGAYAIVLLTNDGIILARDKNGIRPLVLGRLGDAFIAASESCAIEVLGGEIMRDVGAGEQIYLDKYKDREFSDSNLCAFEYVYFSRPDSILEGRSVYDVRILLGKKLAQECPVEADICLSVPDSGRECSLGFSRESGIPYENGILRTHYAGRTFIQPNQVLRNRKIRMKLSPVSSIIKGKDIVVIDDSIVRGNTSRRITEMLREAGANKIHFRISSPPVKFPCYYGLDTESGELVASSLNIEEIRKSIKCDSLAYLSQEGMIEAIGLKNSCMGCFSGRYLI